MKSALFGCYPPCQSTEAPRSFPAGSWPSQSLAGLCWCFRLSCLGAERCTSTWAPVSTPHGDVLITSCQPDAEPPVSTLWPHLTVCLSSLDFLSFQMRMFWRIVSKALLNWRNCSHFCSLFIMEGSQVNQTLFALGKSICRVVLTIFMSFTGLDMDSEMCLDLSSNWGEADQSTVLSTSSLPFLRMGVILTFSQLTGTYLNHHDFPQMKNSSLTVTLALPFGSVWSDLTYLNL